MREYEDMKDIIISKEQEEMMNIICNAWEECRTLKNCKECPDRPKESMRMMMCTALKYTRKLIEAGYAKQPTADVQEVRHGHWIPEKDIERFGIWDTFICSKCCYRTLTECNYCANCGAKMDEEEQE